MLIKILKLSFVILFIIITFSACSYATNDVLMDLANTTTDTDNTIYGTSENVEENTIDYADTSSDVSVNNDYDISEEELSITNMINIIFIVVGIVLILLGIAIIIKLK